MNYVDVVATLALIQYLAFGGMVGQARTKYGVEAPATTGAEGFERMYRVQMNTLELLVALVPALYISAKYWPAAYVAAIGAVYLIGRTLYWQAYISNPARRGLSFTLSIGPVFTLVLAGLVPAILGKSAA